MEAEVEIRTIGNQMLTAEAINALLRAGEGPTLEFKERFGKEALRDYVNRIATATEPAVVPTALPWALQR